MPGSLKDRIAHNVDSGLFFVVSLLVGCGLIWAAVGAIRDLIGIFQ